MPSATLASPTQRPDVSAPLPVGTICEVLDSKTGAAHIATILSRRTGSSSNPHDGHADADNVQYYVHRHDQDKRLDGWVDQDLVRPASLVFDTDAKVNAALYKEHVAATSTRLHSIEKGKRKADDENHNDASDGSRTPSISRQASPALHDRAAGHRARNKARASSPPDTPAMRNIDRVLYGNYDIKSWYHSPYPLDHDEDGAEGSAAHSASSHAAASLVSNKRNQSPSALRAGATASAASKRAARRDSAGSSLGGALSTSIKDAPAIKALAVNSASDAVTASGRQSPASGALGSARGRKDLVPTKLLWICDGCFKYMKTYNGFAAHRKFCRNTHPPGRKVYQRGAHIIWEVDGATETLYCQNLSLFGKLFIDHKTIYFDVEPFMFYVLTDAANASFDHPLGFFSKEKISYDDYNLACIVTFPPFQRKSFGTLMIEFSYYLSAAQGMLGTPERPLSDLGFKGYLSFWTAVLLRALICCLDGPLRPTTAATRHRRTSSAIKPDETLSTDASATENKAAAEEALRRWHILTQRCRLLDVSIESVSHQPGFAELQELAAEADPSNPLVSSASTAGHRRKLRLKGWAGSAPRSPRQQRSAADGEARRSSRAAAGSRAVHPALDLSKLQDDECTLAVTVESLSKLTHLRAEDLVLALAEAGLLDAAGTPFLPTEDEAVLHNGVPDPVKGKESHLALLLTRDAVREAIVRFNVRPAVLDESYALI